MKLFSSRKQKQQDGFAFLVKDMFDLRDGGVVVAGQVTEGIIHQGERAVCITGTGSSFACVIDAIEQPDPEHQGQTIHPEEARADGPFRGHYALRILGRNKSDFRPGDRLLSDTGTVL